jgi:hypothetical protein
MLRSKLSVSLCVFVRRFQWLHGLLLSSQVIVIEVFQVTLATIQEMPHAVQY